MVRRGIRSRVFELSRVIDAFGSFCRKKSADDSLGVDQPLITSGLIDSLALVSLVLELEKEFGVRIPRRSGPDFI